MPSRLTAVCVAIWISFVIACCCMSGDGTKSTAPKQAADSDLQEKRKKVIDGFIREDVIEKVTGETVAKMWVKPKFYLQSFDDKKTLASLVFTWFYKYPLNVNSDDTSMGDHVQIIDFRSGKKVGEFSARAGLSMDK